MLAYNEWATAIRSEEHFSTFTLSSRWQVYSTVTGPLEHKQHAFSIDAGPHFTEKGRDINAKLCELPRSRNGDGL